MLKELVNLENQYFIAKSDRSGSKEQIKQRIIELLERLVDAKSEEVTKKLNALRNAINQLISSGQSTEKEITKLRKQEAALANELAELAIFRQNIKDYFIETIVFPGIFNKAQAQPGFDIVIGNPPYVNNKLISKMGQSQKMEEEYGYCDNLYNHLLLED